MVFCISNQLVGRLELRRWEDECLLFALSGCSGDEERIGRTKWTLSGPKWTLWLYGYKKIKGNIRTVMQYCPNNVMERKCLTMVVLRHIHMMLKESFRESQTLE